MYEGRILLRAQEAAQSLGLSRSKFYELLATEEIASVKIGRSRRISVHALNEYVRQLKQSYGDE